MKASEARKLMGDKEYHLNRIFGLIKSEAANGMTAIEYCHSDEKLLSELKVELDLLGYKTELDYEVIIVDWKL